MNRKVTILIIGALALFVAAALAYAYTVANHVASLPESISTPPTTTQTTGVSWIPYKTTDWNISFAYPDNWRLTEQRRTQQEKDVEGGSLPVGALEKITIIGGGYTVILSSSGRDLAEGNYTHPQYSVDGNAPKTWLSRTSSGYDLLLAFYPACQGVSIEIKSAASQDMSLANKFLDSFKCSL